MITPIYPPLVPPYQWGEGIGEAYHMIGKSDLESRICQAMLSCLTPVISQPREREVLSGPDQGQTRMNPRIAR